jgi:molybdopterin synthase catalytic subunit
MYINIGAQDFDIKEEYTFLSVADNTGAVVTFTGLVRPQGERGTLQAMVLEHYPGMTESSLAAVIEEAEQRWQTTAVRVIHRVGRLLPGDNIVFVGVAASHRAAAFAAAEFIMDYLKTRAPFWKKEITAEGEYWVEQKASDKDAALRWGNDA